MRMAYIAYLLLHNKLPQTLVAIDRNFYVTGSKGQESKSSLAMYF